MKTSESIDEIAAALSKAQGEMAGAKKGADNPFFKSKYSNLSMVIKAINVPFSSNGLSFVQGAEFDENKIAVTTRILHSSGQWIESITYLPPPKDDAQGYGSAITYAKRYGLQALAGVPSVDDDGNDAVRRETDKKITAHEVIELQELLKEADKKEQDMLEYFNKKGFEYNSLDQMSNAVFIQTKALLKNAIQKAKDNAA